MSGTVSSTGTASVIEVVLNGESTISTSARAARDAAQAAAAQVALDLASTSSDVAATTADRVQTGLDRAATAADRVQTGVDRAHASTQAGVATTQAGIATTQAGLATTQATTATTQADVATTQATSATASAVAAAADRVQTGLDRTQTGLDRTATAADRVQTGLDRVQTGQDRAATAADAAATAADRIATGQDRAATGQDRVQTGLDRTSATGSATSAANSASTASTQAGVATTQATAAATSRAQAENAVASVTVGSTNSLAYPEQVRSLITATDVVDVMIYDTRLDSDGGAWTERCTGTSWFNEALNTATRGAKRAFPKVALIVARSTIASGQAALSIYDSMELDPVTSAPRLWKSFAVGAANVMALSTPITSVFAANGSIYIAAMGNGLFEVKLPSDVAESRGAFTANRYRGGLGDANQGLGYGLTSLGLLLSATCNYVHAQPLPGARLDPASGLPIPTIVVATPVGLSVIHPDQRVANITAPSGYTRARFTADRIIASSPTNPHLADVGPIPYAATTTGSAWRTYRIGARSVIGAGGISIPDLNVQHAIMDVTDGVVATQTQIALIAEDAGDPAASLIACIGPTFNSGWMPQGATAVASLAHGVTGAVTGTSELVTHGDFAGGLTGWTTHDLGAGAVSAVSGGVLHLPRVDANNIARASTTIPTIIGESYRVSYDQAAAVGTNLLIGTVLLAANITTYFGPIGSAIGRVTVQFVATSTTTHLLWACQINGATAQIDNISARIVAPGANGVAPAAPLDVVGTLNRAAVGTGNDVVGWSGFSAANYLTQPSNAALAVGTGDVMVAVWVNVSSFASAFPIALAQGSDAIQLGVTAATGFNLRLQSSTATTDLTVNGTTQPVNQWVFVVGLRRAGVMELWVNGVREATLAAAGTLTATPGALDVGRSANASVMSLAMLRIAAYAPTPAQIQRMFGDERPLFQPGARAFLGGASTAAVRRISRSRFSNRLAVSMSDGLAVMDGLQRVERHTTATLSPAMASNNVTPVAMESGLLLIGTTANAGVRRDAVIGMDRLPATQPSPAAPRVFRARGVTTDATPLTIAPRIPIGERETVVVTALIVARVYGASDTQRLTYERRATYHRDAGGGVTLAGSVQTIGSDVEVTGTADATLAIDTTAQTVAAQVTGIAATRLVWTVRYQIERSTHDTTYEEVV